VVSGVDKENRRERKDKEVDMHDLLKGAPKKKTNSLHGK
jgi:hypothetical protein